MFIYHLPPLEENVTSQGDEYEMTTKFPDLRVTTGRDDDYKIHAAWPA